MVVLGAFVEWQGGMTSGGTIFEGKRAKCTEWEGKTAKITPYI